MWLDTQLEMHMIKAFKEMSLCLCAHGGREIGMCYSVFHVLFSLFFFFFVRVVSAARSCFPFTPLSFFFSHWAGWLYSSGLLFVYGGCTR